MGSWSISKRIFSGFGVVLALLAGLVCFMWSPMVAVTGVFREYRETARQNLFLGGSPGRWARWPGR